MTDESKITDEQITEAIEQLADGYANLVSMATTEMTKGRKLEALTETIDGLKPRHAKLLLKFRVEVDAREQLGLLKSAQDEYARRAFEDLDGNGGPTLH